MSIDAIRDTLASRMRELDMTPYRLRQLSGVDEHVIDRFLAGQNSHIGTVERMLHAVGVELIPQEIKGFEAPPPARKRGRPRNTNTQI